MVEHIEFIDNKVKRSYRTMDSIMFVLEELNNGLYVAELSTGEFISSNNLRAVYNSCVRNLKQDCHLYHKYTLGSSAYSAKIYCPSGFKFEMTVYDFAFYKGLAIERDNKTYYCAEKVL